MRQTSRSFPPDNCPVCQAIQEEDDNIYAESVENGFTLYGHTYHVHDYVLMYSMEGVCDIAQILEVKWSNSALGTARNVLIVRALGRIGDLVHTVGCPDDIIKDEVRSYLFF